MSICIPMVSMWSVLQGIVLSWLTDCAICMFVRASQSESVKIDIRENLEVAISILAADATFL